MPSSILPLCVFLGALGQLMDRVSRHAVVSDLPKRPVDDVGRPSPFGRSKRGLHELFLRVARPPLLVVSGEAYDELAVAKAVSPATRQALRSGLGVEGVAGGRVALRDHVRCPPNDRSYLLDGRIPDPCDAEGHWGERLCGEFGCRRPGHWTIGLRPGLLDIEHDGSRSAVSREVDQLMCAFLDVGLVRHPPGHEVHRKALAVRRLAERDESRLVVRVERRREALGTVVVDDDVDPTKPECACERQIPLHRAVGGDRSRSGPGTHGADLLDLGDCRCSRRYRRGYRIELVIDLRVFGLVWPFVLIGLQIDLAVAQGLQPPAPYVPHHRESLLGNGFGMRSRTRLASLARSSQKKYVSAVEAIAAPPSAKYLTGGRNPLPFFGVPRPRPPNGNASPSGRMSWTVCGSLLTLPPPASLICCLNFGSSTSSSTTLYFEGPSRIRRRAW